MSSNVYDLIYASPVKSLMELSSIAVSIELWRLKLRTYIVNNNFNFKGFHFYDSIPLQSILPENTPTPSIINRIVEKHVRKLALSISKWQQNHNRQVFDHRLFDCYFGLRNVGDFSYNYDGTLHWVRTAERMMMCDRFSQVDKFKIACMYCFEDDIRRIWPSVSDNQNLDLEKNNMFFSECPNLYYWICYLRNEMDQIPLFLEYYEDTRIFEELLDRCESYNWSAAEYLWSRIPSSSRFRKALNMFNRGRHGKNLFIWFLLPRLSKSELDRFVAEKGAELIAALLEHKQT